MDSKPSPDQPSGDLPDGAAADTTPDVVPVAAEALSPAVPVEALPSAIPTDQVLAHPVPAEALLGTDPSVLLPVSDSFVSGTEVRVPSLQEVVAPSLEPPAASDARFDRAGEMSTCIRSLDWSQTPLGDMSEWPQPLRSAVSIMLASGFPMLIVWGPECIQLYNDAYLTVLGPTKHPASLGQRAADCWAEIWRTMLGPMFEQVMATGDPFCSEDRLFVLDRHGYREETYFTFSCSAIPDETGRPGGMLVTSIETTERVIGERRLRTLHALAALASRSDTVTAACDVLAKTLTANSNDLPFTLLYLLDTDRTRAELRATSPAAGATPAGPETISLSNGDEDAAVWPIARVARTSQAEVVSHPSARFGPLPGGPWPEHADAAVLLPIRHVGNQDAPIGVLVSGVSPRLVLDARYKEFLDLVAAHISTTLANARAHEGERERAASLVEVDRVKTTFFESLSHELRTPLTLMLGPAGDLLAGDYGPLSAPQREQIRMLRRHSARLLKIVNALLDFSQIEAGRVDAIFEPTDLATFTSDLASLFRSAVERAGLTLTVDCPPLAEPVYVDRGMWEKIVLNLLSNAVKFTFDGGIDVRLRETGRGVTLTVADTGIGIASADLPHLFRHFHRVRGARARSQEGSGIGLALVHELARFHGGDVSVDSEPGRGSTFSVWLRTGDAHLPADRIRRSRPLTSSPGDAAPFIEETLRWIDDAADDVPVAASRIDDAAGKHVVDGIALTDATRSARVLIADDHPDMRQYLVRLLRRRWNVEAVPDGVTALASVKSHRPDLIVADMMMPGLDGLGLLRALRAERDTASIPVLLLSAVAGEAAKLEGLKAGATDYLVKPFFARELVAKIQSQVEQLWLRRQADLERERLRSLFDEAPVPICILRGPELRYEFANGPYARLIGHRDLAGKPIRDALPEAAGQGMFEVLDEVYHTGKTFWGIEVPIHFKGDERDRDGDEESYFTFVYQAIRDPNGEIDGIVVFAVDVTEHVLIRRKIEESLQTRDTFFAAAAHELRNPINALQLQLLSIMRAAERNDAALPLDWVRGRVGKAAHQVSRLVRLIDDLLDVSRIASGRLQLDLEPVDLAAVVAEVIDRLDSPEQALIVRVLEPTVGQWDRLRLDQVLTNLVSNALKYGEGRPIQVTVKSDDTDALLDVSDQGIGIAPEHQERIFERFERVVADRRYAGFGLGLWITSRIVEEFGGSLSVRSEPGSGSTFIVRLPKEPAPKRHRR